MTGPADLNGDLSDDVGRLVRLAGTSDAINADRVARVRSAVHGAWREECVAGDVKTRRRWLAVAVLFAAAASAVIAVAPWRPIRTAVAEPVLVARIDQGTAPYKVGEAVMSGSTITTPAGPLAMTLTSGVHLRLDASSTIRVRSATDVALERGAVYVDSADAHPNQRGSSNISIHTPAGLVSDIGTQFEVRIEVRPDGAGTRVRVRSGQVRVTRGNGEDARAAAGEELFSSFSGPDDSIGRHTIATTGREWAWAERAAPPFPVDGQTLGAFLDWVSHEGAWTVTWVDSSLSKAARATVLHGRPELLKGLTAVEALDVVLPTCGLRYRIDGRRVVIGPEPTSGVVSR